MSSTVWIHQEDHVAGDPDAPIVVVEYGDYQCPYSRRAHDAIKDLQQRLGSQMCFVYRHFPLTESHPLAELEAEAAEAAAEQGKFWEMHDALFAAQTVFRPEMVPELAEQLDMRVDEFIQDIRTRRFEERVDKIAASGTRLGVEETPTFFINGQRHDGDSDEASLATAIMRFVA